MTNEKNNAAVKDTVQAAQCCKSCDCGSCSCGCAPGECRCSQTNCGCGCQE